MKIKLEGLKSTKSDRINQINDAISIIKIFVRLDLLVKFHGRDPRVNTLNYFLCDKRRFNPVVVEGIIDEDNINRNSNINSKLSIFDIRTKAFFTKEWVVLGPSPLSAIHTLKSKRATIPSVRLKLLAKLWPTVTLKKQTKTKRKDRKIPAGTSPVETKIININNYSNYRQQQQRINKQTKTL